MDAATERDRRTTIYSVAERAGLSTAARLTTARQPAPSRPQAGPRLAALGARRLPERGNDDKRWGSTDVLPCEVVVASPAGPDTPTSRRRE